MGTVLNFTKRYSDKISYCQSDINVCERWMFHCRGSRRNVGADCYNNNEARGCTS